MVKYKMTAINIKVIISLTSYGSQPLSVPIRFGAGM